MNETVKDSAEIVTISRTEYNEYLSLKTQNAELSRQVEWFIEQLRLARQKCFGSSSEQSKYDGWKQPNLFNEAEVFADEAVPEPELLTLRNTFARSVGKRRKACLKICPSKPPSIFCRRKSEPARFAATNCKSSGRPCSDG